MECSVEATQALDGEVEKDNAKMPIVSVSRIDKHTKRLTNTVMSWPGTRNHDHVMAKERLRLLAIEKTKASAETSHLDTVTNAELLTREERS